MLRMARKNFGPFLLHVKTKKKDLNMSQSINFDPIRLPQEAEELRLEVRKFLADEIANGSFDPSSTVL